MKLKVGNEEFTVAVADTEYKKQVGLSKLEKLPKGSGLLMKFDTPIKVPVRMSDMQFPLDLIFILHTSVQKVISAEAGSEDVTIPNVSDKVLELNKGEGKKIKPGMEVSIIGEKLKDGKVIMADGGIEPKGVRHVLDADGKNQMNLLGEERIFSRDDTGTFMKFAQSGDLVKLGKAVVKSINKQDSNKPEYSKN